MVQTGPGYPCRPRSEMPRDRDPPHILSLDFKGGLVASSEERILYLLVNMSCVRLFVGICILSAVP